MSANGKKCIKRKKTPSNWKTYSGSSDDLKLDIQNLGLDCFKKEVICIYPSKAELKYYEAYEIFTRHAIPSKDYYNTKCQIDVRSNHFALN